MMRMMRRLSLLLFLGLGSACIDFDSNRRHCYSESGGQSHRLYGTKTTYSEALKEMNAEQHREPRDSQCKPVMFYYFGRHGIRYPDEEDIVAMASTLEKIREDVLRFHEDGQGELCPNDLRKIRDWKLEMVPSDDNRISDTGSRETAEIAQRYRQMFPDLLDPKQVNFEIGISPKARTNETAHAFLSPIYGEEELVFEPRVRDFNDFHATCEEYFAHQGVILEDPKVVDNFKKSDIMKFLIKRVGERLGYKSKSLSAKKFKILTRACSFEFAINGDSPWCSAFNNEELKVIEYMGDLGDYHEDAYGRDINLKMPCPLVKDLLLKINSSINSSPNDKPTTYLHFTHAGAIKPLVAYFGLFNGFGSTNVTTHENFCSNGNENRKWRSSLVSPFGANFAFVLYNCGQSSEARSPSASFKLVTYLQETPMLVNGCDSEFCSLQSFVNKYHSALNCDLKEICRI